MTYKKGQMLKDNHGTLWEIQEIISENKYLIQQKKRTQEPLKIKTPPPDLFVTKEYLDEMELIE